MLNRIGEGEPDSSRCHLHVEEAMGPVVVVWSDASLREVAGVLLTRGVASVAVVDASGTVRGVVTEKHLTLNQRYLRLASIQVARLNGQWVTPSTELEAARVAARTITAAEVMDTRLTSAKFGESLSEVVERMLRREVEYALVWRDGVAVGMLGRRDLLRFLADTSNPAIDAVSLDTDDLDPNPPPVAYAPTRGFRWSFTK
jgi:CBS domain-containing protein